MKFGFVNIKWHALNISSISSSSNSDSNTTAIVNYTYQKSCNEWLWYIWHSKTILDFSYIYIFFFHLRIFAVFLFMLIINIPIFEQANAAIFQLVHSHFVLILLYVFFFCCRCCYHWMRCYRNKRGNFMTFLSWVYMWAEPHHWWQPKQIKQ